MPAFSGWAVVELLGHRTRPGLVSEVEMFGGKMLQVDIYVGEKMITEFYGCSSIYGLRPCSEETARKAAGDMWEFRERIQPKLEAPTQETQFDFDDGPDGDTRDIDDVDEDDMDF